MSKEAAEFRESLGLTYQKLVTIYLETGETSGISVDDLMQAYADRVKLEHTIEALEDSFRWYTPHPSLKEEFEDWKIQSLERHQKQLEQLKTK